MAKQRLDKLLSHEGFGSRKDIKKLLRNSKVTVNGTRILDPSFGVDFENDSIAIDDKEISIHKHIYLMMNKIMHTVSTNKDGEHQTVFDLLADDMRTPYLEDKLHLVGRLDMDTEGLLIFTTDGELTHRLISPKSRIGKTYFCVLEHKETDERKKEIEKLFAEGIEVGPDDNEAGFKCEPADVKWATKSQIKEYTENSSIQEIYNKLESTSFNKDDYTAALLTIHEGKYHQVKRMFTAAGNKVVFLKRISIGKLELDKALKPGEYVFLDDESLEKLNRFILSL